MTNSTLQEIVKFNNNRINDLKYLIPVTERGYPYFVPMFKGNDLFVPVEYNGDECVFLSAGDVKFYDKPSANDMIKKCNKFFNDTKYGDWGSIELITVHDYYVLERDRLIELNKKYNKQIGGE